jgi:integrase
VPSAWVEKRTTSGGATRYRVRYRLGGRESIPRLAGTFARKADALTRRGWVIGELAARRVPNVRLLEPEQSAPTFSTVAETWRASRVDVADGTASTYLVNLGRITPTLGERPVNEITPADVAALVATLNEGGLARESLRKTLATMAMVLDFVGIKPNPARDRLTVKLPRETRPELKPPAASHVLAVHQLLPPRYRLPLLVLDATGMRVGELEALTWGDVDETRSPHDLRHRRISLLHLGGVPWARIGEHVGQRNLSVTANTYTHVLTDETEIDYAALL